MESAICAWEGVDGWTVQSTRWEAVMIGANELTGDTGIERAGLAQIQLPGVLLRPFIPHGNLYVCICVWLAPV